jgi:hypothetical protein
LHCGEPGLPGLQPAAARGAGGAARAGKGQGHQTPKTKTKAIAKAKAVSEEPTKQEAAISNKSYVITPHIVITDINIYT